VPRSGQTKVYKIGR